MTFAYPLLLLAPLVYTALRLWRRSATMPSVPAASAIFLRALPRSAKVRLRGPILLALEAITVGALSVAAARPQRVTLVEQESLGRNIIMVIDASKSMIAQDFNSSLGMTTRMEGVKTVVAEYVRSRRGDRIGLVIFGNNAYLQSPLTTDTTLVEQLVKGLVPGIAGNGTAIGDGLGLALKRLRDVKEGSKAIILITDGKNNAGLVSPTKAAEVARDLGVQIHTVGIGSGTPSFVADPLGALFGGNQGPVAEYDEKSLQEIARIAGGVYFNASSLEGFKDVYRQIDALRETKEDQPQKMVVEELFAPWATVALLAFLVSLVIQATYFRRVP